MFLFDLIWRMNGSLWAFAGAITPWLDYTSLSMAFNIESSMCGKGVHFAIEGQFFGLKARSHKVQAFRPASPKDPILAA
jgi:hypothetical protein